MDLITLIRKTDWETRMGIRRPIRKSLANARWLRLGCLQLGGEKRRDSGCILKIEPERLGDGLGVGQRRDDVPSF